jgi:extracellular matrix protein 14
MQDPANNVKGYFDLHSYGQLLMYPYSYSCDEPVADEEDLMELSLGAAKAIKGVHGRVFNTGKVCAVYAQSGGNAVDWAYASISPVPVGPIPSSTQSSFYDQTRDSPTLQLPPTVPPVKKKIKWSYSIELRDGGTYGFLLPPDQIVSASQEASKAFMYMLSFIAKVSAAHQTQLCKAYY